MGLVMIIGLKIEKIEYLFDKEMVNLLLSMGIKHFEFFKGFCKICFRIKKK